MNYKDISNKDLYEDDIVVQKYAQNSVRARSLNNAEKDLIDKYGIKNKRVLVLGCGAGRLPANLLLYGNSVLGIDRSEKLISAANVFFPEKKFSDVSFKISDMTNLSFIEDSSFDVVIFAMNAIDYLSDNKQREKSIREARRVTRINGFVVLSSHNKLAYIFSPKVKLFNKSFTSLFMPFAYSKEKVIGGGMVFRGNPRYVIDEVESVGGLKFIGFTVDCRSKIEKVLSKSLGLVRFWFPYLVYVFRKK